MRPKVNFLTQELISKIINEAIEILCKIGVDIYNENVISLLQEHGNKIDNKIHVYFKEEVIDYAIQQTPHSFKLFDSLGEQTHNFMKNAVYFNPGSTALNILDFYTNVIRRPLVKDYIDYVKVVDQLQYIEAQSTAMIPSDVPIEISDSYRLFLSLLYSKKPVVTGAFSAENFEIMKDLQLAVRGYEYELKRKPLTIFSICPTSPLKWSPETSQNLLDCAKYNIPVEFIAMPLSGFMAPVTLVGTLIQHTAETLSGITIGQLANPGTPMLYGGSPAIFDVRYETTPMGAIETMMIDCAYNEIGQYLSIPTQAYIAFSDSKRLDAQAGLESGTGAILAALSGINSISGPGMLDFESCQSIEKLIFDNEICGMAKRVIQGIETKEDFPSISIFKELLKEKHLLISDHTLKYLKEEHFVPGPTIDRKNLTRWKNDGLIDLETRAHVRADELLKSYEPPLLSEEIKNDLKKIMGSIAKKYSYIIE